MSRYGLYTVLVHIVCIKEDACGVSERVGGKVRTEGSERMKYGLDLCMSEKSSIFVSDFEGE